MESRTLVNGMAAASQQVIEPDKTIVCGHWDSATFHEMFEGITKDYSPFISEEFICCDSCTALSHQVNVFTFDYDETREVQLCQANS